MACFKSAERCVETRLAMLDQYGKKWHLLSLLRSHSSVTSPAENCHNEICLADELSSTKMTGITASFLDASCTALFQKVIFFLCFRFPSKATLVLMSAHPQDILTDSRRPIMAIRTIQAISVLAPLIIVPRLIHDLLSSLPIMIKHCFSNTSHYLTPQAILFSQYALFIGGKYHV